MSKKIKVPEITAELERELLAMKTVGRAMSVLKYPACRQEVLEWAVKKYLGKNTRITWVQP